VTSRIHPNVLTVAGLGFAILSGVSVAAGHLAQAGVWLLISGVFDMVDGAVARQAGLASRRGAFLDSTLDRWAEGAFLAGLTWYYADLGGAPATLLAILLVMLGSLLVSYVRARAEGVGETCQVGLMERPERFVLLVLMCLLGSLVEAVVPVLLWVLAVTVHATAIHRLVHVYGKLRD